jgi:V8-like Glu-specific endopeptidase
MKYVLRVMFAFVLLVPFIVTQNAYVNAAPVVDPNQPVGPQGVTIPIMTTHTRATYGGIGKPYVGQLSSNAPRSVRIPDEHLNLPPILPPYNKNTLARSVIAPDGRTRVNPTTAYPNRALAYLAVEFGTSSGLCTGWFVGPNTIVTAGHCVYDTETNKWATKITAYAGRNGATAVAQTSAKYWVSVAGWVVSENWEYDYAVIKTTNNTGNTVGWFGWRWQSSNTFSGSYTIRGYPGDKPLGTMWTMNGSVTTRSNLSPRKLWYTIDTAGGQSGSPVYANYNGQCCYGYAVHAYGLSNGYNSGTRITSEVHNNLVMWRSMP